jgi:molybdopterin/thiamine biosynthesis adenylyltransferase
MKPKYDKVIVVGLGGIWSYLWNGACRMMSTQRGAPHKIRIIDGDQFTMSNMNRQHMKAGDEFKMKADVYEARIKDEFPNIKVNKVSKFLTPKNIDRLIEDNSIVLSCLDNHKVRKYLAVKVRSLKNSILITGATDDRKGNTHLHVVRKKELTRGMDKCHPEIDQPDDKNPGELSCEERARLPGGGQTIVGNMHSAASMADYLEFFLKGGMADSSKKGKEELEDVLTKSEVFFDLKRKVMDSISRAT